MMRSCLYPSQSLQRVKQNLGIAAIYSKHNCCITAYGLPVYQSSAILCLVSIEAEEMSQDL